MDGLQLAWSLLLGQDCGRLRWLESFTEGWFHRAALRFVGRHLGSEMLLQSVNQTILALGCFADGPRLLSQVVKRLFAPSWRLYELVHCLLCQLWNGRGHVTGLKLGPLMLGQVQATKIADFFGNGRNASKDDHVLVVKHDGCVAISGFEFVACRVQFYPLILRDIIQPHIVEADV